MKREELLELIPAYALGALDDDERAAVEAWLPTDPEAQRLLEEYQEMIDWLPLAAPAQPAPSHLQADLRRRLADQREGVAGRQSDDKPRLTKLPPAWPRPMLRRDWLPMVAGMAAALVLLVAALLLALRPNDPGAALYARLVEQPGAREIALLPDVEPAPTGELVASPDGREAVIRVENLPDIGSDQTFQLWLVDEAGARSGGLFRFANVEGENYIVLPLEKPVTEYQAFGVSLEPAGGSPYADRPTGPRVFRVEVNA